MRRADTNTAPPSRPAPAKASTFRRLLFAVPVVAAVPMIAWLRLPRSTTSSEADGPAIHTVERGRFVHEVAGGGSVESAKPVEICCEVPSYGGGAAILWIVPEGSYVEPVPDWKPNEPDEDPPDLLVKLDSSELEERLLGQKISCNTYEAALVEAQNTYQTALLAKEQYVEGTFPQTKLTKESKIFVAQEGLRKAEDTLAFNREQLAMGYVTELQVQADEFRVQKAKKDLLEAETDLEVLENYTKKKMLNSLESSVVIAESRLRWREHTHRLAQKKLADLEEYLDNCTIRAPQAGQVVYANVTDHHGHQHVIIEEGTVVRQHQPIIKLPGTGNMQVKASINEARVSLVEAGMPAVVELDALSEVKLPGTVEKVGEYPTRSSWRAGYVKEYEVIVKIDGYPEELELRPGMSAKASIRVEQLDDAVILPVEALFEHGGKHYCVLPGDEGLEARQLVIGSASDEEVVIEEGLTEGEQVALGAARYRDQLNLPEARAEGAAAR